jgi:hypothetical protein
MTLAACILALTALLYSSALLLPLLPPLPAGLQLALLGQSQLEMAALKCNPAGQFCSNALPWAQLRNLVQSSGWGKIPDGSGQALRLLLLLGEEEDAERGVACCWREILAKGVFLLWNGGDDSLTLVSTIYFKKGDPVHNIICELSFWSM